MCGCGEAGLRGTHLGLRRRRVGGAGGSGAQREAGALGAQVEVEDLSGDGYASGQGLSEEVAGREQGEVEARSGRGRGEIRGRRVKRGGSAP